MPFNTISLSPSKAEEIKKADLALKTLWSDPGTVPAEVAHIYKTMFIKSAVLNKTLDYQKRAEYAWKQVHLQGWFKNREGKWVKRKSSASPKNFQFKKITPSDPRDTHVHEAAFDEDGNGGTSEAGPPAHVHAIFDFKVQPFYQYDPNTGSEYVSVHPGSVAFKKEFSDLGECEMEIFRVGTHNGDDFTEKDLKEIADNFNVLKNEVRPKLKMTHLGEHEEQQTLAGLASYGDIEEVYLKKVDDGPKRLFAKVINIPHEVLSWIKERRFPERSIEIYPEFKLGTKENAPIYKNVLKAIALLGHQMPAVTGMAPIKLEECLECQGTECVIQKFEGMGDTHTADTDKLTALNPDPEGEGFVKYPTCQCDIPIEKLENDNTGYSQCPMCGKMITREGLEGTPAEKDLELVDLGIKLLKSNIEFTREGGD